MSDKLTEIELVKAGVEGITVQELAKKKKMTVLEICGLFVTNRKLADAYDLGRKLAYQDYVDGLLPLLKEKFLDKIKEGNDKMLLWAMDNIVADDAVMHKLFPRPIGISLNHDTVDTAIVQQVSDEGKEKLRAAYPMLFGDKRLH